MEQVREHRVTEVTPPKRRGARSGLGHESEVGQRERPELRILAVLFSVPSQFHVFNKTPVPRDFSKDSMDSYVNL